VTNTTLKARSLHFGQIITQTACSLHLVTDITLAYTLGDQYYAVCMYLKLDDPHHTAACTLKLTPNITMNACTLHFVTNIMLAAINITLYACTVHLVTNITLNACSVHCLIHSLNSGSAEIEAFTEVFMKNQALWDITPLRMVNIYWLFEGSWCLTFQHQAVQSLFFYFLTLNI
jgi:hypothetical protein